MFANVSMHQNHLERLLKHSLLGLPFRISQSAGLRLARVCISNKLSGAADVPVLSPLYTYSPWCEQRGMQANDVQGTVSHLGQLACATSQI